MISSIFSMIRKYRTEIEQYLKSLIEQESMKRQEIQQKLDLKVNYLPFCSLMDSPIHINAIGMGLSIIYYNGSQVRISKL